MKKLMKVRLPILTCPDPFVATFVGKEVGKFIDMDIIIIGVKTDRAYFVGQYGSASKPVCSSSDGVTGVQITDEKTGDCILHDCEFCSFRVQQFKPCKQYLRALIMDTKTEKFYLFQIPPMSIPSLGAIEFDFEIRGLPIDRPIHCFISSSKKLISFSNAVIYDKELPFKFVKIEGRDTVILEFPESSPSILIPGSIPEAIEDHSGGDNVNFPVEGEESKALVA